MNILHKIKNWLIVLVFGVSVYAYSGTQGGTLPNEKSVNIEELLQNKTAKEKAQIKSEKISKIKLGKFTKNDLRIEVIGEITAIEINGQYGIEFFAKAWKFEIINLLLNFRHQWPLDRPRPIPSLRSGILGIRTSPIPLLPMFRG